jgi:hypothetical protein
LPAAHDAVAVFESVLLNPLAGTRVVTTTTPETPDEPAGP